ncbi:hypothetical protein B0H94_10823 [Salsuginibacillus halophilus]|uniref:CdiI immunity protein domain-containing protein n=1 Tax=Salsuginibacillus halophilus TaxID=517424 RepID=A0A2P8HDW8_9BACI|nr:hypothetical protein [Salsuginibacillus halophilus]PSL44413.1 hypothetical protein B0H94_10823 [Salsuginibacillus halophilus]
MSKERIVEEVVAGIYKDYPWVWDKFGERGKEKTIEDNYHHLDHLYTAYSTGEAQIFLDYTDWLVTVLTSRGVGVDLIVDNFERLEKSIPGRLPQKEAEAYLNYLQQARVKLET